MSEWKKVKLGEIADVRDGTHDSPKQVTQGKFLITSRHIKQGRLDFEKAYYISIDDFNIINKRSKVDKHDILFSMIGTIAETVIIDFEPDFAIKNVGLFKTAGDRDLSLWIFYYLKSTKAQDEIHACMKGSTQQYITLGDLRSFPIELPPFPEQKAIAEVLSSLDDKIDLLHRQNKTLEQMAETLFRQWFVEEAKEDWEERVLEELINIGSGKGLKKDQFIDNGKYPVLGANGKIGRTNEFLFNDRLIFTGRVGTLGNVFRVEYEKVWLSDNTLVINPRKYYNFIYFILKDAKLGQYNVGSTQPLIRQSDIKEINVALSCDKIHIEFEKQSDIIFGKIKTNQTQIHTLEKMRDTLLPKLMSGEIKVNK